MKTARRLRPVAAPEPTPIGGLMDKRFVYVPAAATDIRRTFQRVIEAQKKGQFV